MSDIHERIKKLGDMFKEMQVTEVEDETGKTNVIYVVVAFPQKWIIGEDIQEKFDIDVMPGKYQGEYYFCADISVGFDKVFDAIDHCIGVNKDAMERAQIFQEKINELKAIFGDGTRTIAQLRTIEFTFPPQKKGMKKTKAPIEEVIDKELGNGEE